jgi:beta-lactamase class A
MISDRRTLLAALAATAGLIAAGCAEQVNRRTRGGGLDLARLARGFAPLARRALPGIFNLGVMSLDTPAVWCADENRPFPMRGISKAPLAAAALAEIDAGRMRPSEMIRIGANDLSPPPSRLNRLLASSGAKGFIDVPAIDLIALAVRNDDDTAADSIMRRVGGPGAVTAWLRGHDITTMRLDRYEREIAPSIRGLESFRAAWGEEAAWAATRASIPPQAREAAMSAYLADPRDTTTAQGALNFLNQLSTGALLSKASTALLLRLMNGAGAAPHGLRAGLPVGAVLAHQGGAAETDLGFTPATNDIGLVSLPDGRRLAIAALLSGSTATRDQRDALIADGARLAVSALI